MSNPLTYFPSFNRNPTFNVHCCKNGYLDIFILYTGTSNCLAKLPDRNLVLSSKLKASVGQNTAYYTHNLIKVILCFTRTTNSSSDWQEQINVAVSGLNAS